MAYYDGWAPYVPVAQRRAKAAREMEKLKKKGLAVTPVVIAGRTIAKSFWGKAWCDNLERYSDYSNRLPRGRAYVRNGSVVNLQISAGEVYATVSGSSLYQVKITIAPVSTAKWKAICSDCTGAIDSLVELLQGRFSKGVMERICRPDIGLFPAPKEIKLRCDCPDGAYMCKHVAAVLYGIGARLDQSPELLFRLNNVDEKELIAQVGKTLPLAKTAKAPKMVLESDDLSAMFGLEMGSTTAEVAPAPKPKRAVKKRATKKAKAKPAVKKAPRR